MSNYNRITVWGDGQGLTPTDLNAEFDAIRAVLNGGLDEANFESGEIELPHFVNAGSGRFQTGGLDNAALVAAAIAEAVIGNIKIVWVPATMFGYGEEVSYSSGQFDATIGMVFEGLPWNGHDPVAYGAKPDDPAVNDSTAIDAAKVGALAAGSTLPRMVQFAREGEYTIDTALAGTDFPPFIFMANARQHELGGVSAVNSTVDLTNNVVSFAGTEVDSLKQGPTGDIGSIILFGSVETEDLAVPKNGGTALSLINAPLVAVDSDFILRSIHTQVRKSVDAYDNYWAHGVGSRVGNNTENVISGGPDCHVKVQSVMSSPNSGDATKRDWHAEREVTNEMGADLDISARSVFLIERVRRAFAV